MLFFLIFKYILILEKNNSEEKFELSKVDITEPRFAINNPSQKIFITAKEGNFVDDSKILLRKNVIFESKNFKIQSDDVIFDKKKFTAHSKRKSVFSSKNTTISSDGFDIYDNGNKIKFNGKSLIILKWIY